MRNLIRISVGSDTPQAFALVVRRSWPARGLLLILAAVVDLLDAAVVLLSPQVLEERPRIASLSCRTPSSLLRLIHVAALAAFVWAVAAAVEHGRIEK